MANVSFNSFSKFKLFISKKNFIKIFKTRTLIQVFLFVGGENGILVKNYLKIPISPLSSISSKYQNLHLKLERFKIKKIEVEKMVWLFQVEKMGSPSLTLFKIYKYQSERHTEKLPSAEFQTKPLVILSTRPTSI